MTFKVGDVVMLKSGGPHMTVAQVFDSNVPEVACIYFQGSPAVIADKLGMLWQPNRHREVFPSDALQNVGERKSIVIPQ